MRIPKKCYPYNINFSTPDFFSASNRYVFKDRNPTKFDAWKC